MTKITNFLDLFALIIQLSGSILMFYNSPDNFPDASFSYGRNPDYETPKRKNKLVKRGFGILGIGFLVAIVSLILKDFFITSCI
jgi:hypothetical protein